MKFAEKTSIAIALFLMFAMTISIVAIPATNAQTTRKTYAYIGALPNPVGVNQEVLLHIGITQELSLADMGWEGLSVTIERPDGKTDKIENIRTDSTGGTGRTYTPPIEGNYTLQTHFPEQKTTATKSAPGVAEGTTMLASSSAKLTLVVQEEPVPIYPKHALPTEYWSRPIDAQLREWSVVAGNWPAPISLMGTSIAPAWSTVGNEEAPESPHVLWTKPIGDTMGGLVGGEYGEGSFGIGDAYEGKWSGSIILTGILYYNRFESGQPNQEVVAVDLHTGEELWCKTFLDNKRLAFGQILYWSSFNYHGAFSYLWVTVGTTWHAFEAITGEWRYTMTNVPSGTNIYGPDGTIYRYTVDLTTSTMTLWNSTKVPEAGAVGYSIGSWGSRVRGVTYDAASGIEWNVTIPTGLPGAVRASFLEDRLIGSYSTLKEVILWGISLKPGDEGRLLFNETWKAPNEWAEGNLNFAGRSGGFVAWSLEDKVGVLSMKETRQHYAFSLENGKFLWGPTEPQIYLDIYFGDCKFIADGKLYSANVGGIVYCYDVTTGDLLWTYEATDTYSEFLFGNNWWLEQMFIADGKLYLGHAEHSPVDPRPRGAPFICLNATTGELIWRADGLLRQTHWGGIAIIGDSIIVGQDTYSQRIFAIGKGPSATTVAAGPKVSVHGSSVLVEGMVTDISPGTDDIVLQKRFPSGVPAVSDANMSDWMLYVYKQFERPADIVGVEVVISVLDPNGNCYEVGRATSDASGFFSAEFEPLVPGKYTVIATFEGSNSYYGSFAETALLVEEAPVVIEPTPSPAPMTDTYVTGFGIAMIIAIVVVGLLLFLLLRKR